MTRRILLTVLALTAFAANSLLCRLALLAGAIDPASFTVIRLGSGALTLVLLLRTARPPESATWTSGFLLALYAVPFAFAYRYLATGTGALLLFGAVQSTMILGSYRLGKRLSTLQWLGLLLAFAGLVYLVLPGVHAPSPVGAGLMLVAGAAWGVYSLRGRAAGRLALALTGSNFLRATPIGLAVGLLFLSSIHVTKTGVLLAVASGAIASGLGYVTWYRVLPELAPVTASVVQLAVPPLAAAGGILFLGEFLTVRLAIASTVVLGGIAVTLLAGTRSST
ncbi:MAG TPA: DMT family transporter [Gemmatimonadales bacterium]|nr:DMT family transporter [Gemmatimonadales bacterium]